MTTPKPDQTPTLRDHFAMAALQGCISFRGVFLSETDQNNYAVIAYRYADAMMKAREVKP